MHANSLGSSLLALGIGAKHARETDSALFQARNFMTTKRRSHFAQVLPLAILLLLLTINLSGCDEIAATAVAEGGSLDLGQLVQLVDLTTKSLQLFKALSNDETRTVGTNYTDLSLALKAATSSPGRESTNHSDEPSDASQYLDRDKTASPLLIDMKRRDAVMQAKADKAREVLDNTGQNARALFGLLEKRCNDITDDQLRAKAQSDVAQSENVFYRKLSVAQNGLAAIGKSVTRYRDIEAYLEVELGRGAAQRSLSELDQDVQSIATLNEEIQAAIDDGLRIMEAQRINASQLPSQGQEAHEEGRGAVEPADTARRPQDAESAPSTAERYVGEPVFSPAKPVFSDATTSQVAPAPVPILPNSSTLPVSVHSSAYVEGNQSALVTPPISLCTCQRYAANVPPRVFYPHPRYFRPRRWVRLYR